MQQKHGASRQVILMGMLAVALVVVVGTLLFTKIPAPQKPIEKELDAKAFLESKPQ